MSDPKKFCASLDAWADLMAKADAAHGRGTFGEAWNLVRLKIRKSCLLARTIYGGEKPSQTPCPVHEGRWSGIHLGWPGTKWSNGEPIKEDPMLRKWYDAGCRCYQHGCGCTTGWQPDEHCGCVKASAA